MMNPDIEIVLNDTSTLTLGEDGIKIKVRTPAWSYIEQDK